MYNARQAGVAALLSEAIAIPRWLEPEHRISLHIPAGAERAHVTVGG